MKRRTINKRMTAWVLALSMVMGLVGVNKEEAYADGYLNHVQNYTLGQTVSGALDNSDYYGSGQYWDVYRFDMSNPCNVRFYMESTTSDYFGWGGQFDVYSSSNPNSAILGYYLTYPSENNARGVIYYSQQFFLSAGTYYLAIRNNRIVTTSYSLKLSIGVSSITVTPAEATLQVGETVQLTASVAPDNADDKTVYWSSSNTDVASVSSSGLVTAASIGTATITAQDVSGEVKASCEVSVVEDISAAQISDLSLVYTYDGYEKKPTPTVTLNGKTLSNGSDYTLSYANNINAGIGTITITGKGNYSGSVSLEFYISKANNTLSLPSYYKYFYKSYLTKKTKFSIGASGIGKITYTLSKKAKKAKIKVSKKGKVTIPKRCKKGKYKITVKAAGNENYYGAKTTLTIYVK